MARAITRAMHIMIPRFSGAHHAGAGPVCSREPVRRRGKSHLRDLLVECGTSVRCRGLWRCGAISHLARVTRRSHGSREQTTPAPF
jgi:hypothetical protein